MRKVVNKGQAQRAKEYKSFSSWRYTFVSVCIGLFIVLLLIRLATIQIVSPKYLTQQADKRSIRVTKSIASRGNIEDRYGEQLAVSVPAYAVWVDPKAVLKKVAFTKKALVDSLKINKRTGNGYYEKEYFDQSKKWPALAEILGINLAKLKKIISKPHGRFIYLKRQVSVDVVDYITKLHLPGIAKKIESQRYYPTGEINANILGLTNLDGQGIDGIEKTYNTYLQGQTGIKRVRKDRLGNVIDDISVIKKKKEAGVLQLSIDQRVQAVAYHQIKKAVEMNRATSGSIVVINVHTGEVFAMANYPSFNPNDRSQYQAYKLRNRAITDSFEPGSTVKPLVMTSALLNTKVTPDEIIDTSPGWINVGGRRVRDGSNLGKIDLATILQKSSNVGISKISLRLKPDQLEQTFSDLGLGNDTGINLIGESAGTVPHRNHWSPFELATMSFGYGITTTTLQLAKAYAILANGGISYPLTILKQSSQPDGRRVIPQHVAREVVSMMEGVSKKGGTAPAAKVNGYRVAGKTGTTRVAVSGGYGDDYISIFAGVAPASDPQFSIVVMINEPQGDSYYAGVVAAPVFSSVMRSALLLSDIPPDNHDSSYTLLEKQ